MANQDRISVRPECIGRSVNDVSVPGFAELPTPVQRRLICATPARVRSRVGSMRS